MKKSADAPGNSKKQPFLSEHLHLWIILQANAEFFSKSTGIIAMNIIPKLEQTTM